MEGFLEGLKELRTKIAARVYIYHLSKLFYSSKKSGEDYGILIPLSFYSFFHERFTRQFIFDGYGIIMKRRFPNFEKLRNIKFTNKTNLRNLIIFSHIIIKNCLNAIFHSLVINASQS